MFKAEDYAENAGPRKGGLGEKTALRSRIDAAAFLADLILTRQVQL